MIIQKKKSWLWQKYSSRYLDIHNPILTLNEFLEFISSLGSEHRSCSKKDWSKFLRTILHVKKKIYKVTLREVLGNVYYKTMLMRYKIILNAFSITQQDFLLKIFCSSLLYLKRSNFFQHFRKSIFFKIFTSIFSS